MFVVMVACTGMKLGCMSITKLTRYGGSITIISIMNDSVWQYIRKH